MFCGDLICSKNETCMNCPLDCGYCEAFPANLNLPGLWFIEKKPNIWNKIIDKVLIIVGALILVIGGLFFYPGTEIIMNVDPILILMSSQPKYIVKAYVYHVLLHEYLHSLGLLDEYQCRKLVLEISKRIFKDDHHPIIKIALEGIGIYLPNLRMLYIPPMRKTEGLIIEYLSNFDEHGLTYYS